MLEALHLREASAGRRIGAMRVLRRFPWVAEALRDGRLCLSTLAQLRPVLTEENAEDLLARAAFRTNAEVDHLVASLRPRPVPREGLRLLPTRPERASRTGVALPPGVPGLLAASSAAPAQAGRVQAVGAAQAAGAGEASPAVPAGSAARTAEMRAVSQGPWSLRVTVDRSLRDDLETLAALLSHKVRKGDVQAILHEAHPLRHREAREAQGGGAAGAEGGAEDPRGPGHRHRRGSPAGVGAGPGAMSFSTR